MADNYACQVSGAGDANLVALTDDGDPQLVVHFDHCAYVPSFGCEVNLLSVQAAKSKGVTFTFGTNGDNQMHFPNGSVIKFGDDMTITPRNTSHGAMALPSTSTRCCPR